MQHRSYLIQRSCIPSVPRGQIRKTGPSEVQNDLISQARWCSGVGCDFWIHLSWWLLGMHWCLSRWWFKYVLFSPWFGEDEPILGSIFFRMGWFNHQPVSKAGARFHRSSPEQTIWLANEQLFWDWALARTTTDLIILTLFHTILGSYLTGRHAMNVSEMWGVAFQHHPIMMA